MARYLHVTLLLCAFSILSQAQVSPTGGDSGLQIVNYNWTKHGRVLVSIDTGMPGADNRVAERLTDFSIDRDIVASRLRGGGGPSSYNEELRRRRQLRLDDGRYYFSPPNRLAWSLSSRPINPNWTGYSYTVQVLNDSGKKIEALEWDYFFVDPATGNELQRHRFRSKVDIDPKKKKKVRAYTSNWPVALVYVHKGSRSESEKVEVSRIIYSDGTTWER